MAIESCTEGLLAAVLLVDGSRLRVLAGPSLPAEYNRASDGVPIGEGFGSCGTAAFRRKQVVVSNIQEDPLWRNYREIARRYGLASSWSTPILNAAGQVLGTFALYSTTPRRPESEELALVDRFSRLALLAIERHRMAEALAESQRGYRQLAADLEAVVWEADPASGRFTEVTPHAEAVFGYPIERWLGEPDLLAQIVHDEDRALTLRRRREAIYGAQQQELEYRVRAADGRLVWVRELIRCGYHAESRALVVRGVLLDLSRQREAERAREDYVHQLSLEQTLLRAAIDEMPDGVLIVAGPSGEVLAANRRIEQILGFSITVHETLGHYAWWQGSYPDGQPYTVSDWPAVRALKGELVQEEMRFVRADGTRGALDVRAVPLRGRDGQVVASVITICDVTERKRAEEREAVLADASARLVSSLDAGATADGVAAAAVHGFATWCLVFALDAEGQPRRVGFQHNNPSKRELGATFDRLASQPGGAPLKLSEVLDSGTSQLFPEITPAAFAPGAVQPALAWLLRDLGTESAMTVALKARDRVVGAVMFGCANGEHRYNAADLQVGEEIGRRLAMALDNARLYDEGQAAVRRRDQFLAIAAHELRTPLTSLKLKLQTLIAEIGNDADPALRRIGDRVRRADGQTERLARLVDALLDVSVIYAKRFTLRKQDLDLVALVHAVVARFEEEAAAKRIDIAVHTAAPMVGRWDRLRIEQVIANLVANAIKYGAGRPIRLAVEGDARCAWLTVEDEGIGMSSDVIRRIVQPFERGVPPGEYSGLGLGLYITDQIVRAHGGALIIRSTPGHGSTFTVELPRDA